MSGQQLFQIMLPEMHAGEHPSIDWDNVVLLGECMDTLKKELAEVSNSIKKRLDTIKQEQFPDYDPSPEIPAVVCSIV